ncbi:unnamed protein product [Pedinophyceae sp. YPF-701]|nr:unnamed protein product [Pedinophyceae sp. YPF-701]
MGQRSDDAAALFERVLWEAPEDVLGRLPAEDKASLAGASWSTLEAVLRGSDGTLRMGLDDAFVTPLLARLARDRTGAWKGSVECCGVGVSARHAGALVGVLRDIKAPLTQQMNRWLHQATVWWQYVHGVVEAASQLDPGALQVTRLVLPSHDKIGPEAVVPEAFGAMELMSLQHVLASPAVRDSLRCLRFRHHWVEKHLAALAPVLRGLPALEHLEFLAAPDVGFEDAGPYDSAGVGLVRVLRGCPRLRRLDVLNTYFGVEGTRDFLEWLSSAATLQHLTLYCSSFEPEAFQGNRALPPDLEVFDARMSTLFSVDDWSKYTRLRTLVADRVRCTNAFMDGPWVNAASTAQLEKLLRSSTALRRLELGGRLECKLECAALCALLAAAQDSTSLEVLDLPVGNHDVMGDDEGELYRVDAVPKITSALTGLLRGNVSVRELSLRLYVPEPYFDVLEFAAAVAENTRLRKLSLDTCCVGDQGAAALGEALRGSGLMSLTVRTATGFQYDEPGMRMSAVGARKLIASLASGGVRVLRELDLSGNDLGGEGAAALAAALPRLGLRKLDLACCGIGDEGAVRLAEALSASGLQDVSLERNKVGDEGARALSAAIEDGTTLVSLNLGGNRISEAGGTLLSSALQARDGMTLDLRDNKVQNVGRGLMLFLHAEECTQGRIWL